MHSYARACEGAECTHALRALFFSHTLSLTHTPDFGRVNRIKLSFAVFDFVHGKCDGIFLPEVSHFRNKRACFFSVVFGCQAVARTKYFSYDLHYKVENCEGKNYTDGGGKDMGKNFEIFSGEE